MLNNLLSAFRTDLFSIGGKSGLFSLERFFHQSGVGSKTDHGGCAKIKQRFPDDFFKILSFQSRLPYLGEETIYLQGLKWIGSIFQGGQGLTDESQSTLGLIQFLANGKFILV